MVVTHVFNPSTWDVEAGGSDLSVQSQPELSTELVPGQLEIHGETLPWKTNRREKKKNYKLKAS